MIYGKGLPTTSTQRIKGGRINNKLRSKRSNKLIDYTDSNIGVFRCSPISANLCIIYADRAMEEYSDKIRQNMSVIDKIRIRNINTEIYTEIYVIEKLL